MLEWCHMIYSGSQLKKIRLERNIPLEQVATATRIRLALLEDLEDEEYSELSSSTQTKGFLRIYADFLGLPDEPEPDDIATPPVVELPTSETLLTAKADEPQPKSEMETKNIAEAPPPTETEPLAPAKVESDNSVESESQKELEAIGRELAARRRYLNVSWDLLESESHIPKDQIRNLERGDLDAFIDQLQFKGILQSYASFLNLDVSAIMMRYASAIQKRRLEKSGAKKKSSQPVKILPRGLLNLRRFFTLDLFFGTLMILGILAFLIWGISRMSFAADTGEITGTLPAVADILLSEETQQPTPEIESTEELTEDLLIVPTATAFFTESDLDAAVEVVILTRQNTWLRILSDGDSVYQGRQAAGNVLTFTADESIEIQTGNVAGIEIIYNQNPYENSGRQIGTAARLLFTTTGATELPLFELPSTSDTDGN